MIVSDTGFVSRLVLVYITYFDVGGISSVIDNPSVTKNALYMAGTSCYGPGCGAIRSFRTNFAHSAKLIFSSFY